MNAVEIGQKWHKFVDANVFGSSCWIAHTNTHITEWQMRKKWCNKNEMRQINRCENAWYFMLRKAELTIVTSIFITRLYSELSIASWFQCAVTHKHILHMASLRSCNANIMKSKLINIKCDSFFLFYIPTCLGLKHWPWCALIIFS